MVKLSVSQAVQNCTRGSNPVWAKFFCFFFPPTFFNCKVIPAKGFQHIFNNHELLSEASERARGGRQGGQNLIAHS